MAIIFTFRYVRSLNNLTENIVFIEVLVSATNMTFLLFVFGSAKSAIEYILYLVCVVYNIAAVFILCFYGDHLTNEV